MTSLQEKGQKDKELIKSIQLEITGLKTEVSSLKDKKAIICQDKQLLKNYLANYQKENLKLKKKEIHC